MKRYTEQPIYVTRDGKPANAENIRRSLSWWFTELIYWLDEQVTSMK